MDKSQVGKRRYGSSSKLHGWVATLSKKIYNADDSSRQYAAGALKSKCTFRITLSQWKKIGIKKNLPRNGYLILIGMRRL
jgi:hypothetical protein